MGLTLLQEEIAMSLGFKSSDDMLLADEETRESAAVNNGRQDAEWFHLAHEVQTNAQSSVDVLNDLLNYDKIESGTLQLEFTVVPIWELIERTISEFKLPFATKGIKLDIKLPVEKTDVEKLPSLPQNTREQKVVGDYVRLTQVLRNLVSNAFKFAPEGGSLSVEARWIQGESNASSAKQQRTFELKNNDIVTYDQSGELEVKVTDTGAGMSKEQLAKLFRQGVQFNVNDLQAGQGSGLGLFIAKGIVEQHGGRLFADSEGLGCGTTFTMTIPLYHVPEAEPNESQYDMNVSYNTYRQSSLRVLIVDDATSNRKLLGRLLKNRGHAFDETEDGHFAVEMVGDAERANRPYDMVLLDYEMPILNGPEAAKKIRDIGIDVFIVGITGNMMPEDVAYFRSCGANAVLPKPFKMSSLEDLCVEYQVGGRLTVDDTHKTMESVCDSSEGAIDAGGKLQV
jgi:signal transduction histidine kinase/CheY-like chemotaxis protein